MAFKDLIHKLPCKPRNTSQAIRDLSKVIGLKHYKDYENSPFYHSVLAGVFLHWQLDSIQRREVMENIFKLPGPMRNPLRMAIVEAKHFPNWNNAWGRSTKGLNNEKYVFEEHRELLKNLKQGGKFAQRAYKFTKQPTKGIKVLRLIVAVLALQNEAGLSHVNKELKRRAACRADRAAKTESMWF